MNKMKNTLKKKCCVSFCKNSSDAISRSLKVTFHEFPTDQLLRDMWLTALGMEESHITDTTVVCSLHFRNADFCMAKSGLRMLHKGAVPSAVQVCLICLNTDTKLYPMSKYHLEEAYTNVTGLTMPDDMRFAQWLCAKCAHRLMKANQFRDNCLRAHQLLLKLATKRELLTTQNIKRINRTKYKLETNLVTKIYEPDHCDLHVIEHNIDDKSFKQENNAHKDMEVKKEINETLEIVLEPMDMDFKCDNESDQEFLNDDIDNDAEFLNKEMNTEVEISNNDDEEWNDYDMYSNNSDVEVVSDVEVASDSNNKNRVPKKCDAKPKVTNVSKARKTPDKSKATIKVGEESKTILTSFTSTALTYDEQLAEIMQRKESSNYENSQYKCSLCYRGFASLISYNRHVVKHTNQYGEIECTLCKLHFKNRRRLNHHIRLFHSMRYSCTTCSYVTKQKDTAILHARWHEGTKYKCPQCNVEFSHYSTYMSHLRIKHPSDIVCALCGYSFVSEVGLQQHCKIKHRFDDQQNFTGPLCELCNVRFASEDAYNVHVKVSSKHASEGVRARNDPTKWSHSYRKRRAPDADHEDEYITCEQCGIQLRDFTMYRFHFKRVHPDKERTQYSLQYYKRCLCELCGKVLKSPTVLKYHMAEHGDLKPYQCDTCSKRFAVKANLAQHVKVHMRSDFECGICGKHFNYKSNRDQHLWIHHEKYFKCEKCDKRFKTAIEMRAHLSHMHLNKPWPSRKRQGGRGKPGKEIKTTEDEWKPEYDVTVLVEYE